MNPAEGAPISQPDDASEKWLRWGYQLIGLFLLIRLAYLAAGRIELCEDESYQWLWSKHLALSYYSKPPIIAYLQFLGTSLWGDNEFGIRFLSPVLAALLSVGMLQFLARNGHPRAGFWLILMLGATPLMALGSILLTVDVPSVFFWVAAMIAGWRAVQGNRIGDWGWTGVFMGLGFLSKYTAVVQVLSWMLFFALWKPARRHLRRPGPYLALTIALLAALPVLWWNHQHGWITMTHLYERGGLDKQWQFQPRFIGEFLLSEAGLLNPIFFVAMIWTMVAFWRTAKGQPLWLFLFSMGAPLFIFYLLYTVRVRVLPNWIAPSVVPLFALLALYGDQRWRSGDRSVKRWLAAGLVIGFTVVGLLHGTECVKLVTGRPLPYKLDPLHRVRGWTAVARMAGAEREKALAEGKPVFFITQHYGLAGILSFYLPEAKQRVDSDPLVYYIKTDRPMNQFYFWPGYQRRTGQNALYLQETDLPSPPPPGLTNDFQSVSNLGMREVWYEGRVHRRYQLYFCRGLRPYGSFQK